MTPTSQIILGSILLASAAIAGAFGGYFLKKGLDNQKPAIDTMQSDGNKKNLKSPDTTSSHAETNEIPNISFQKVSIFHIEVDNEIYQLGVVVKLFNLDSKSHLINGIAFDKVSFDQIPRHPYYFKKAFIYEKNAEIIEDNYIKPDDFAYFKLLLPIKMNLAKLSPPPPEIIFFGDWQLIIRDKRIKVEPEFYSNFDGILSPKEWDDLLKPASKIDLQNLHYKRTPIRLPQTDKYMNYLLYHPDRSAIIDIYGFSQTPAVKGENGVMVFLRGKGRPPLKDGWVMLGKTYAEVWGDPRKLALYKSIYPPDKEGNPKPFGVFLGAEKEMIGH